MNEPLVIVLPADHLDHRLQTARCAPPALPSDLAAITATLVHARPVRGRAVATWHWYRTHRRAIRAAQRN